MEFEARRISVQLLKIIGVWAVFLSGGGGGGSEPLPKKFLQLAHIFTKQRKETRVII